jgi:hypothetical protein
MKYLLFILIAFVACKKDPESVPDSELIINGDVAETYMRWYDLKMAKHYFELLKMMKEQGIKVQHTALDNPMNILYDPVQWADQRINEPLNASDAHTLPSYIQIVECKHIYVAVRQPEVKAQFPGNSMIAIYTSPPSGKHEGEELVCVKCFHLRKQIIDYGEPIYGLQMPFLIPDTLGWQRLTLSSDKFYVDTTRRFKLK